MNRDFRTELASDKCFDRHTQALVDAHGEPLEDAILQSREELVALCEFIEAESVRSYLEIGIWTGRLVSALHRLFAFDLVAACDHGWAEQNGFAIHLPPETRFFRGDSASAAYRAWRRSLGHVDLVLIDANHAYHAVKRDFAINRDFPHRFLAFHDITGATRQTTGVAKLWREIDSGEKREIVRPHGELGLDHSIMGIGIWSASANSL
jgi:hypothetical protein